MRSMASSKTSSEAPKESLMHRSSPKAFPLTVDTRASSRRYLQSASVFSIFLSLILRPMYVLMSGNM